MHKHQINKGLAAILIGFSAISGSAEAKSDASSPFVHAASACLIDVRSGRILYEKNGQQPMRIASLTKIVTGWIAIKSGKLNTMVTVSNFAARQEGSSVYLRSGERVKMHDLLYAMMMRSGNDAAMAIAEAVAGSNQRFAQLMNEEARRLHLAHTHFANPHGLDQKGHYASADDLATMTAAALRNPVFHQVVNTKYYRIQRSTEPAGTRLKNKNKLLWMMEGADGVKTGYTKAAGRCLAASASRSGRQVALVLLDDPSDWVDAKNLLNYGLQAYRLVDVATIRQRPLRLPIRDGIRPSVAVVPINRILYPLRVDEAAAVTYRITQKKIRAPIHTGDKLGDICVTLHGQALGKTALVAAEDMPANSWWGKLRGLFS